MSTGGQDIYTTQRVQHEAQLKAKNADIERLTAEIEQKDAEIARHGRRKLTDWEAARYFLEQPTVKQWKILAAVQSELERLTGAIDADTKYIAEQDDRIAKLEAVLDGLQRFVDAQAEDEGLWFIGSYASEAYIQNGLRACHRYIEQAIASLKDTED